MVARTFNPSTRKAEAGGAVIESSLVYRASSRVAEVTQKNPILKNKTNQTKSIIGVVSVLYIKKNPIRRQAY